MIVAHILYFVVFSRTCFHLGYVPYVDATGSYGHPVRHCQSQGEEVSSRRRHHGSGTSLHTKSCSDISQLIDHQLGTSVPIQLHTCIRVRTVQCVL